MFEHLIDYDTDFNRLRSSLFLFLGHSANRVPSDCPFPEGTRSTFESVNCFAKECSEFRRERWPKGDQLVASSDRTIISLKLNDEVTEWWFSKSSFVVQRPGLRMDNERGGTRFLIYV